MSRVDFLVDGFNLYHSTRTAEKHTGLSTKWLDIRKMCDHYMSILGRGASLQNVYYFSALATHLLAVDAGKIDRHKEFIECLEDTGIIVQLGKFKKKRPFKCRNCGQDICGHCNKRLKQHEEKETDVAIGAKMLELLFTDSCDAVVLVTGDTDLAPAVRIAQHHFPKTDIRFAMPYKRHNTELKTLTPGSFDIGTDGYTKNQFPDVYTLKDGSSIRKPNIW